MQLPITHPSPNLARGNIPHPDEQEIHRQETNLNGLLERESRLIHLYTLGEFDDTMDSSALKACQTKRRFFYS